MKTCPHCNAPIPRDISRCPQCGAEYWKPGEAAALLPLDKPEKAEEQEGCASLLMLPLLVSLCVTAFLILSGFVLNALARFESQQFKLLWMGGSLVVGILIYRVSQRIKQKMPPKDKGGMES
ncbi:MAG: hypothetical protein WBB73_01250 [Candidatus Aminicenantaceae bacterium]